MLFGSSMRDRHARRIYRRTKITRKASDAAENLQLYRVVRFFDAYIGITISGGRTEQPDIIAGFLLRHWLYK